jgi:hypothetical protein
MAKLSADLRAANLHPRENLSATGNLAALNAAVSCYADGASTISFSISGTYVGTLAAEGTVDGTNWDAIPVKPINVGGIYVLTLASAAVGRWMGPAGQFQQVRIRMSAYTSGSANVTLMASNGAISIEAFLRASDQHVTNTGVAAAAVTLTLAAAGAGLFHYITRIVVQRHTSALLTAGATPVLVTTTNMPGSRVFSIPADAAPQGQVYAEFIAPTTPIRATAANTATTIVAPVTTGVIWRLAADYYNAP